MMAGPLIGFGLGPLRAGTRSGGPGKASPYRLLPIDWTGLHATPQAAASAYLARYPDPSDWPARLEHRPGGVTIAPPDPEYNTGYAFLSRWPLVTAGLLAFHFMLGDDHWIERALRIAEEMVATTDAARFAGNVPAGFAYTKGPLETLFDLDDRDEAGIPARREAGAGNVRLHPGWSFVEPGREAMPLTDGRALSAIVDVALYVLRLDDANGWHDRAHDLMAAAPPIIAAHHEFWGAFDKDGLPHAGYRTHKNASEFGDAASYAKAHWSSFLPLNHTSALLHAAAALDHYRGTDEFSDKIAAFGAHYVGALDYRVGGADEYPPGSPYPTMWYQLFGTGTPRQVQDVNHLATYEVQDVMALAGFGHAAFDPAIVADMLDAAAPRLAVPGREPPIRMLVNGTDATLPDGTLRPDEFEVAQSLSYLLHAGRAAPALAGTLAWAWRAMHGGDATQMRSQYDLIVHASLHMANRRAHLSDAAGFAGNNPTAGAGAGRDGGPDTPTGRAAVLIVTGQSNERGSNEASALDPADPRIAPDPRILEWPSSGSEVGSLVPARERLRHFNTGRGEASIGPAMPAARALLAALGPDDLVIVVPCAVGGSDFAFDGEWAVGGPLQVETAARLDALRLHLETHYPDHRPDWTFVGMAGENDAGGGVDPDGWLDLVAASFEDMAASASLGEYAVASALMSPAWVEGSLRAEAIDGAKLRLRERLPRVATVASPDGPYDPAGSDVHFAGEAQLERGRRIAAAIPIARARAAPLDPGADLLDALETPLWGAYSLRRRLLGSYGGPALTLRRESDGLEAEIGFTPGGLVDTAAIRAHCADAGGVDGRVVRWHDQSGQGRHFEPWRDDPAPRLVIGGRIRYGNGHPMLGDPSCVLAAQEQAPRGAVALVARLEAGGTRQILSSRGMVVWHDADGRYAVTGHSSGPRDVGSSVPDGVHMLVGEADEPLDVDGGRGSVETIGSANGSAAGLTTLLARVARADQSSRNNANARIGELVIGAGAWTGADRARLHGGTLPCLLPD